MRGGGQIVDDGIKKAQLLSRAGLQPNSADYSRMIKDSSFFMTGLFSSQSASSSKGLERSRLNNPMMDFASVVKLPETRLMLKSAVLQMPENFFASRTESIFTIALTIAVTPYCR